MSENTTPEEELNEKVASEEVQEEEVKEETEEKAEEAKDEKAEEAGNASESEESAAPGEAPASSAADELAALKEAHLRTLAEYDNYRKRTTKEKEAAFGRGVIHAVEAILPVVDNFERALAAAENKEDSFVQGVQLTYNQMIAALAKVGVTPIDCKGKPFDPHFHNAVMHVDDENLGENTVAEVFLTGYMYNDTLLRAAMVKVAN